MAYRTPLDDLRFLLHELVDFPAAVSDPEMMTQELALTIWEEAGKFAAGVLSPLNACGDRSGLSLEDGVVTTPDGFAAAWQQLIANGWNNMALPESIGTENGGGRMDRHHEPDRTASGLGCGGYSYPSHAPGGW